MGPGGGLDPKFGQKRKWDFWNQRVEGGTEKSSFAKCLVGGKMTIFNGQKNCRRLRRQTS